MSDGLGFGFGVGVTLTEVQPAPPPVVRPDGVVVRPGRLHELLPADALSDADLSFEIGSADRVEAIVAAYKAERIVALAERRSSAHDPAPDTPGVTAERDERLDPEISEFFPDELALILNCSRTAATVVCDTSITLVRGLPATFAALADGELDWPRARAIAGELGWKARDTPPSVVAAVEAAVLPEARSLSVSGLRAAVRRELLSRDSLAADARRQQAERAADVTVRPLPDGMAELSVFCPLPMAHALRDTLDGYARLARDTGDPRRLGQLRVGVLTDLVLRPWDTSRPAVTAHLTVITPLPALRPTTTTGAEPAPTGEVNGEPITAGALRALLEELDALCPGGLQTPTGGSLLLALTEPRSGRLRAVVSRRELERLAARGCPDHPTADCACPLLEAPPPVQRYRPSAGQGRFTSTRDRTCRHPGCRNRAVWADLDHVLPHADGGATDCTNLCCLCRRHHRLKTHAPGWSFVMDDDGVLTVTTPTGVTRVTRPPGLLSATERVPVPPDDPPPF